jgi:tetratricopeptide (TPR) repeat protein
MEQQPIAVFFSYSREDKPLRDKLEIHLSGLRRQGVISSWHDREIVAGSEWEEEIDRHMRTADIILLLISPAFVASRYCYEIELPYAMARHEAGEACVVPILLQEVVGWQQLIFAKLQVYPSGGTPLADWRPQRKAFADVVKGIAVAVNKLLENRQAQAQLKAAKINQEQEEQARYEHERLRVEQTNQEGRGSSPYRGRRRPYRRTTRLNTYISINSPIEEEKALIEEAPIEEDLPSEASETPWGAIVFWGIVATLVFVNASPKSNLNSSPQAVKEETASTTFTGAEAFFARGVDKQNQGDYNGALSDYAQAIKLKPDFADAYHGRGKALSALGDKQAAIADFDQAIKLNPDFAPTFFNRGITYLDLNNNQFAITDFDQAIKLNANYSRAYNGRGLAHSALGEKQAAIADFDKAIEINKNWEDSGIHRAFYNRGNVRHDLGDNQAAIADFDNTIKLQPDNAYAFYNRGVSRADLGDKPGAIADLQKAVDLYQKQGNNAEWRQKALNRIEELQQ